MIPFTEPRSCTGIDFDAATLSSDPRIGQIALAPSALREFNALAHALYEHADDFDSARITTAVAMALHAARSGRSVRFIPARMARAQALRDMAADADWSLDAATRAGIDDLLAYVDRADDLIPDGIPLIGLLDDAILVDVALNRLRDELDDYLDFRRYRDGRIAAGAPAESRRRDDWLAARGEELRYTLQRRRVDARHYAHWEWSGRGFRVT
ncbi:MAG: YkvA family protein [Mizugakiibacter sp.]|uniref:YkvA family protein n=1 Tax=Mizugakiibacter sp. TaxID=1972610 RepID=UPI0031C3EB5D|nr:DUF1232 domain-containing protein [Xanthomonadaceae bacterium]